MNRKVGQASRLSQVAQASSLRWQARRLPYVGRPRFRSQSAVKKPWGISTNVCGSAELTAYRDRPYPACTNL